MKKRYGQIEIKFIEKKADHENDINANGFRQLDEQRKEEENIAKNNFIEKV